jgi:hypothetical protein
MDERFLPAQHRSVADCAAMGLLAVLWLACLVLGVGGASTTRAISDFGLIAAAEWAGVAGLVTARSSTPQHRRMWKLLGRRRCPGAAGRPPGPGTRPPSAAAALTSLPFAAQSLVGRVRQVLDGLMIAASLLLPAGSWC